MATLPPRTRMSGFLAAVAMGLVAIAPVRDQTPPVNDGPLLYVAPWGDDAADGSVDDPFRTINIAVHRAQSGTTVVLRGGTYRESVQIYGKAVHLRSEVGERAVLDAAVPVEGWEPQGDDWSSPGWTRQFYSERSGADVARTRPEAGYPDQVFLDGRPLVQVLRRDDVEPGTFFHDTAADRLWIGDDPSGRLVEASTASYAFYFHRADGSSLTDVTVRRYATERRHMAAIRAYSDDLVLDGLIVEHNARIGVSAMGSGIVLRDSRVVDNGHMGVHGNRLDTFVVERVGVHGNNKVGFDPFHSASGIKVTSSTGVTIRDSHVSRNGGPGIWTDLDTRYVTIVRNLVEANGRAGVEVELSQFVNVLSNVVLGNGEAGIWVLESSDVQVLHNASFANTNAIEVEDGPRADVGNVRIKNNTVGDVRPGSKAVIDVNDWTGERSAAQMGVVLDHNAYWMPDGGSPPHLLRWAQWPASFGFAADDDALRRLSGRSAGSVVSRASTNPFVGTTGPYDYRLPLVFGAGVPLRGSAAAALGLDDGTRLPPGPVVPVVER
ncbi:MAG: right-handed parallel beta-helix repeat-containing protein [Ilumatobacter sp.]|uniref:right-handed parallel beta-helix repeat-containing protein n=1 Tax=Ilumatobacter sp. TaxID=1967498 RepID=UPI00391B7A34